MTKPRLLVVHFEPATITDIKHLLGSEKFEIYSFFAENESNIHANLVDRVDAIKPDLLIIPVGPDLVSANQGSEEFVKPGPLGLQAVELLRRKSDVPVAFLDARGINPSLDDEVCARISKIEPAIILEEPIAASDIELAAKEALALSQSKRLFLTLFYMSSDGLFTKDESLRFVSTNAAFEKILNRDKSRIIGLTEEDLFDEEAADISKEIDKEVLDGASIHTAERVRRINGVDLIFREFYVPLRDVDGKIVGILGGMRVAERYYVGLQRSVCDITYRSRAMQNCLKMARSAAQNESVVLLLGESGSGKDYVARYIHDRSHRLKNPYFSVNCAAIPLDLAESELFGHERGAYTGAVTQKRGLLELAGDGTLLLNEIGDLPLPLQAKLLTFLDTRKFTRVGGEEEITANARLIAATNRDLQKAVKQGHFRQDLFYRINVLTIGVPSLRERLEDLPSLVNDILRELCHEKGIFEIPDVDHSEIEALKHYHWPGNIRELRNVLERALFLSPKGDLSLLIGMPDDFLQGEEPDSNKIADGPVGHEWFLAGRFRKGKKDESEENLLHYTERSIIEQALEKTNGNQTKAARLLGVTLSSLKSKLNTLGIKRSK